MWACSKEGFKMANMIKKSTAIREPLEDRILNAVVWTLMILLTIVVMYPLIFIVSSSFSSGQAVSNGKVLLWPVQPSIQGYKMVFAYKQIWVSYRNTIIYTVVGTCFNVFLNTLAAYPLSRKNFQGRGMYTALFMFIMLFSGGLIPTYVLMSKMKLNDTPWIMILLNGISVYNMVVMRTFFQNSIPNDLFDAARIDGISDIGYLFRIVLPLSKAVFAVIVLYYAVGHWNSYFTGMMYLRNKDLYPLQVVLRNILNASNMDLSEIDDPELLAALTGASDLMKYSVVVVSAAPVLIAYQFVRKFFEKGVMLGSVKG